MPRLLFKGGTSLSKCFDLIHRFSEDIDLGIERKDIGLGGDLDPMTKRSRKGFQKAVKVLTAKVSEFVASTFLPSIQADFESVLRDEFNLRLEVHGSENVLMFEYPRSLDGAAYGGSNYIAPAVRLELGARSDHYPVCEVDIQPYAAERFPDEFESPTVRVVAQAPERTLLEKALILHTGLSKEKLGAQSSRHAYDLAMMHRAGVMQKVSRELFEEVAHHKFVFGDDKPASLAPTDGIHIVPEGHLLQSLEADYRNMQPMFFSEPTAPLFEEIVLSLGDLEAELNRR